MQLVSGLVRSGLAVLLGGIALSMPDGGAVASVGRTAGGTTLVDSDPTGGTDGSSPAAETPVVSQPLLLASLVALEPSLATQAAQTPRFVYRQGSQGVGYYASPTAQPAPAAAGTTVASRSRTVGPNNRNWATGNRVPLHRPWMRARN